MQNLKTVQNVNPATGEVTDQKQFETKLVGLNMTSQFETPNGKQYRLGTIEVNCKNYTAQISNKVAETLQRGDTVTVRATKLDTVTVFSVIGGGVIGSTASASLFDELTETVKVSASKPEEVGVTN